MLEENIENYYSLLEQMGKTVTQVQKFYITKSNAELNFPNTVSSAEL